MNVRPLSDPVADESDDQQSPATPREPGDSEAHHQYRMRVEGKETEENKRIEEEGE